MYAKTDIMRDKVNVQPATMAERFRVLFGTKYRFDLDKYAYWGGPNPWDKNKKKELAEYCIVFTDGSEVSCIMTDFQRDGLVRLWDMEKERYTKYGIHRIGGQGYRRAKNAHATKQTIEKGLLSLLVKE